MIIESKIIEFQGMPLFQKAKIQAPFEMNGDILEFACFFYVVEGQMLSYDSCGLTQLKEKEAVIKNCNHYVQQYLPRNSSQVCEAIAVYLYPDLLKTIYKDDVPDFQSIHDNPVPKKLIANKLVEQYMLNLSIYFESPEAFDDELGVLKLKELMKILLKSENHQNIRKLLSEIFNPVDVEFQETIKNNYLNPLTIEQLAYICNMSLSTFKRHFKKVFNDTPAKYIKNQRLEHAAQLLRCSQDSVSQIAFQSGFQELSTFSSSFHHKFSLSPKNYRLNYTGK